MNQTLDDDDDDEAPVRLPMNDRNVGRLRSVSVTHLSLIQRKLAVRQSEPAQILCVVQYTTLYLPPHCVMFGAY